MPFATPQQHTCLVSQVYFLHTFFRLPGHLLSHILSNGVQQSRKSTLHKPVHHPGKLLSPTHLQYHKHTSRFTGRYESVLQVTSHVSKPFEIKAVFVCAAPSGQSYAQATGVRYLLTHPLHPFSIAASPSAFIRSSFKLPALLIFKTFILNIIIITCIF